MYLIYAVSLLTLILVIIFYENKYLLIGGVITFIISILYGIKAKNKKNKDTKDAIREIFTINNKEKSLSV